ncbi:MAG: hypothetical protein L0G84_05130 [Acinetobacter sp.]|nr:hypothetical protein [Acinetobacter sp.]
MKAFKYLVFFSLSLFSISAFAQFTVDALGVSGSTATEACKNVPKQFNGYTYQSNSSTVCYLKTAYGDPIQFEISGSGDPEPEPEKCAANGTGPFDLKVSASTGRFVCMGGCQYVISKCVDVTFDAGDFEPGMTCDGHNTGQECGTPKPTNPNPNPVTQDPINPTDKPEEQRIFENIMHVIGEKLDGIKDAITGGNQNQNGGDTGGSNGGDTGGDVNVNVDMSETNAKIDETNSLIDELTKWLQGEDLGDDIFGDSEPPEKELTPQQFDTSIFSSRSQCPADARLSFNLLGGKSFTKTFEFKDWCDNLEIFGSLILIASYLFGAYIIVSKS